MTALTEFEADQERARRARQEARDLRNLHGTATCGLPMQYTGIHYGTRQVATHIAARIADSYLVWADEYDAHADRIEANLATILSPESKSSVS